MLLTKIRAEMFRNYKSFEISPAQGLNIFIGHNAQGKTNLLESIYFNLNASSFRAGSDREVINWQANACNVISFIRHGKREYKQTVAVNREGKKKILVNGVEKKKKDLLHTGVILFTPDDLNLVKNSPGERRKFLDYEIGPFYPNYKYYLGQYLKILSHRNSVLKNIRNNVEGLDALDVWNDQLVINGTNILLGRIEVLKKLTPLIKRWHSLITQGTEKLEINYLSSLNLKKPLQKQDIHNSFIESIKKFRDQEIRRCQSLVGPHRDDVVFLINGREVKVYGSQGQHRTLVLSLKLAQVSFFKQQFNTNPILLLDDVLSELDNKRREVLLSGIKEGIQTFITTNDFFYKDLINGKYKLFTIREGEVASN
ncbi:DNA replication/repair protein RecF [Desulfofalx alkaliphila]|uniref:DNA replication/repair protein RecF n=1 Tax=Desulfofalx alkaliphila TaxID=105483 RepID=UPI0004E15746|nr:DNA replication/repair protein RecF [Desulfofalx alkaliphila]